MGARHKPREGASALLVDRFTQRVRERFPAAPAGEARRIARYACGRGTERVGVLAGPDGYLDHAVELAVVAHLRHRFTEYEPLLAAGVDRDDARARVQPRVLALLGRWGSGCRPSGAA